jgi:hypothetical protein
MLLDHLGTLAMFSCWLRPNLYSNLGHVALMVIFGSVGATIVVVAGFAAYVWVLGPDVVRNSRNTT